MEHGIISILVALVSVIVPVTTAIVGMFALRAKASTEQVERLDRAQSEAMKSLQAYADMLEARIDKMASRETQLTTRMSLLETEVYECHQSRLRLESEVTILRKGTI